LESGAHGTGVVAASVAWPHVLLKRSDMSEVCPPTAPPATVMSMWPPSCWAQTAEWRFVAVRRLSCSAWKFAGLASMSRPD
jgi:hypothetical protein